MASNDVGMGERCYKNFEVAIRIDLKAKVYHMSKQCSKAGLPRLIEAQKTHNVHGFVMGVPLLQ